jgi:HTH-type transcriptional regulator/antitoxin HigA
MHAHNHCLTRRGARTGKTEAEHAAALKRIEKLMDVERGGSETDELELLICLVDKYETATVPIDPPDPIEAIKFRMSQQGLKNKDLIPYIGSASKVSEVLSGGRGLSLTMIRNIVKGLGIPEKSLLGINHEKAPTRASTEPEDVNESRVVETFDLNKLLDVAQNSVCAYRIDRGVQQGHSGWFKAIEIDSRNLHRPRDTQFKRITPVKTRRFKYEPSPIAA